MNLPPGPSSQRLVFTNHGTFLHHIAWLPPPDHSWKLNFAGFVADQVLGIGGAAFIIRDEDASFKTCCATPLKLVTNIVIAELLALINGLDIAMNLGIENLEIEGDCNTLFHLLDGQISSPGPVLEDLVEDCLELLRGFRSVTFHRVNVISNQAANRLAILAAGEREPLCWSAMPPNAILGTLVDDVIGRWVPISDI